ncbi:hypothetical protein DL96DRAFT_1706254 [Flagelloscypha sp. PMI_526]|nr:hypothetical protein DL96DRAFT_1706254 [Flagelloscypha sp. PMI_526]
MSTSAVPPRGSMLLAVGPAWLGSFFHNILAGILIVQTSTMLLSRGIIGTILRGTLCGWGDKAVLNEQQLDWFSTPVLTAITSAMVQAYFRLSRLRLFQVMDYPYVHLGFPRCYNSLPGLALGVISEPTPLRQLSKTPMFRVVLPLYTMKSGIRQTDKLITRIIRLTVETGTLTAVWSILLIIIFYTEGPWFHLFADTIGKLYANNMMVMFNRRVNLSSENQTTVHHSMGTGKTPTTANGEQSHIQFASGTGTEKSTIGTFRAAKPGNSDAWELEPRGTDSYV